MSLMRYLVYVYLSVLGSILAFGIGVAIAQVAPLLLVFYAPAVFTAAVGLTILAVEKL